MREDEVTADRLAAYSDAVFTVIVTVMVLELRSPEEPTFSTPRLGFGLICGALMLYLRPGAPGRRRE